MLEFSFDEVSQTIYCKFFGRMDTANADLLTEKIDVELAKYKDIVPVLRIFFDLAAVDYVASSFLRLCIYTAKFLPKGNFSIINTDPQVLKVFKIAGMDSKLPIS